MHKKAPKIIPCTKKHLKFAPVVVSEAKIYLYHSTKIAKAWPGFDEIPYKL